MGSQAGVWEQENHQLNITYQNSSIENHPLINVLHAYRKPRRDPYWKRHHVFQSWSNAQETQAGP